MNRILNVFEQYGINSVSVLTTHCLESLIGLDVRAQLRQQKVVAILRVPLLHTGGIKQHIMEDSRSGFDILLNDTNNREDDIATVAHELGHTFEACYNGKYLEHAGYNLHMVDPQFFETSEDFAESFGRLWLEQDNNREGLSELLNSSPTPLLLLI